MPENNSIDLVISFDTTGSMYPCLTQVRRNVQSLVQDLFNKVPELRVGIVAHGDYCDAGRPYDVCALDLTSDVSKICTFIQNVAPTDGGDQPECYELALRTARQMSWRSGKSKVVLLIGDDVPHGPTYPKNTQHIDWRNELQLLLEASINVYGVHAMPGIRRHSKQFYEEIAQKTGGFYLTLDQFATINDVITAVAVKQAGQTEFDAFVNQAQKSGKMNRNLSQVVGTLSGKRVAVAATVTDSSGRTLEAVPPGRFQILDVDSEAVISNFVTAQGVRFNPGRGFYQLTKSEKVQSHKEILQDKATGDLFTGRQVRDILGLPVGVDSRLSSKSLLDKYNIFIQSTSYNRKLVGGTKFLYEVEDAATRSAWLGSFTRTVNWHCSLNVASLVSAGSLLRPQESLPARAMPPPSQPRWDRS